MDLPESLGCADWVLSFIGVLWAAALLGMLWNAQANKYHYVIDVTHPLPHSPGAELTLMVGLTCVVTTVLALASRRGTTQSRLAIGWALAFAAIAIVGGMIVWAQPANVTCETPGGVSDIFESHSPVPCGDAQSQAAGKVMDDVNQDAARLVAIGVVAAVITGAATIRRGRRNTPPSGRPPHVDGP